MQPEDALGYRGRTLGGLVPVPVCAKSSTSTLGITSDAVCLLQN